MYENFTFSEALSNYGTGQSWVPSDEAWAEINRLQAQIDALNRDYLARDVDKSEEFESESHDKLIALQTQVLAFLSITMLIAQDQATFEQGKKVLAELQRLALE